VDVNGDSNKAGNVLWRNVETPFLTIVAVEKQQFLYVLSLSVALGIQHVKPMNRICELSGCTIFSIFLIIS